MSAPQRPQLPSSRPVSSEDPYFEDQEAWSDDPSDEHDEAPRRKTRQHSIPSRAGRPSGFVPGQGARGETVPYGRPSPRRGDSEPFVPTAGPGPQSYYGYYNGAAQTPFTSGQQYQNPGGTYPQDSGHYSPGYGTGYGTGYAPVPPPEPSPYSSRPYYSSASAEQPAYDYTPPYQSPPTFGSPFNDGRTGIRGPSIRVRKTQPQPQQDDMERDREVDKQRAREKNRQREREEREARKKEKERERKELDKIQREKLKLKVQRLQHQLEMEKRKAPVRGDFEPPGVRAHDLMDYLHSQREQENRRKLVERTDSMTQLLQDLAELAEVRRATQSQQDRLQLLGGLSPRSRPPTRSEYGESNYESVQKRQIEEVLRDLLGLGRWNADEEKAWLPLPPPSHYTARSASEDPLTDDEYYRSAPRGYREEDGVSSPRPRFGDAPGNISDAYTGPSSPRHRSGDALGTAGDSYPSPESSRYGPTRYSSTPAPPSLGRRQTAPPAAPPPIIKVVASGSSKRARGSDMSSEYSLAADRGEFPIYESRENLSRRAEQHQEELRRRAEPVQEVPRRAEQSRAELPRRTTEPVRAELRRADSVRSAGTRRSTQSAPRSAMTPEGPRLRHTRSRVSFQDQDPAGDRPIVCDDDDDFSGYNSEDVERQTRPYRFTGEKVQGRRYNPRESQGLTPPPAPDAPRSESSQRSPPAAGGSQRSPRRQPRVENWSDDDEDEEKRFMSRSRESTVGR